MTDRRMGWARAGLRAVAQASFAATVCAALPVSAQQVTDCDRWQANARNVDWSQAPRVFANGAIRIIALDTTEPAAAAFHLMVTFADPEELFLDCGMISAGEDLGFTSLTLADAQATYDPERGLRVEVPARRLDGEASTFSFIVNRATGQVTLP